MHNIAVTHGAGLPAPMGPYSRAFCAGELVFASGQTGVDPATGQLVKGGVTTQTAQVLRNQAAVLRAAGVRLCDVVKATVYLTDMRDFAAMNAAYGAAFAEPHPARTTVAVAGLPGGAAVEIELVARATTGAPAPRETEEEETNAYRSASAWQPR